MSNIGAIVLYKIIEDQSLHGWSRLKLMFLDPAYISIFNAINNYYNRYNKLPNFLELESTISRDSNLSNDIATLKSIQIPEDIDLDVAIDVLIDNYTQTQTLNLLDKFLDNITLMTTQEIKDTLSEVVINLDEKTHTSETVVNMNNILLFTDIQDMTNIAFPTGINNVFDSTLGGAYRQELILIGGSRGAGKSVVCNNFVVNQYELNNTAVYFTIEMNAKETFERSMAILSGVPALSIKQNTLSEDEILKLVKARASMFEDSDDEVMRFLDHRNRVQFEASLVKNKRLRENQMIIIDDRELSLTAIDLHLQKLKSRFGDKLTMAVIDYLNQIVVSSTNSNSMYEWATQVYVSKKLKEFARKYDIAIISPYQIDANGQARFAKGILDAPDIALILDANSREDSVISFDTTKIRGGPPISFNSPVNWDTLKIYPQDVPKPSLKKDIKEEDNNKSPFSKKSKQITKEDANDVPWN